MEHRCFNIIFPSCRLPQRMLQTATGIGLMACLLAVSVQAASMLDRLQGAWVSDREATVAAMKEDGRLSLEAIEQLAPVLGKLTVRYDGENAIAVMDDYVNESRLQIVNEEGNVADIDFYTVKESTPSQGIFDNPQRYRIEIHDDHYWLLMGDPPVFRERFIRVQAKQDSPAPAVPAASVPGQSEN